MKNPTGDTFVDDILVVLTGSIYKNAEIVFTIAKKNDDR